MELESTEEMRLALRAECTETNLIESDDVVVLLDDLDILLAEIEKLRAENMTLDYQYGELVAHSRPKEGCEE